MEEYDLIQIWNIKDHQENGHMLESGITVKIFSDSMFIKMCDQFRTIMIGNL